MLKAKFTRGLKLHQEKVKNQGQTWVPAQGHTGTTGREAKARPGFPLRGIRERLMVRHTGTTEGEAYGND
ncbi:MAG: hypothetical protein ABFD50_11310 [Smithella sp.]